MKFITAFLGATLASAVFMFNLASAGEMPALEAVDKDQDGMINTEEAAQLPELSSIFAGADLDQDGKLNSDEYDRAKRHIDSKGGEEAAE